MPKIQPCLWFDTKAEEAARFYTSVFKNSRITTITHYGDFMPNRKGTVMTVEFELDGQMFVALNGGPEFKFTEAVSFMMPCRNQQDIDEYWSKLGAGGQILECGWLKDKYGLAWQIVPEELEKMLRDPDQEKVNRVMQEVLKMKKLEIEPLKRAFEGAIASASTSPASR